MEYKTPESVNFAELKFASSRKKSGIRCISVYHDKKPFALKLPKLRIPFDAKLSKFGKFEVNLSLSESMVNVLTKFDDQIKAFCVEHDWSSNDLEYTPCVKESFNGNYAPTLRFSVPIKDGVVQTLFFSKDKVKLTDVKTADDVAALLKKGTVVHAAVEFSFVWLNDSKFGVSCVANQIRIMDTPSEEKENVYDFVSDDDESVLSGQEYLLDDE